MQYFKHQLVIIFLLPFIHSQLFAQTCTSTGDGDWDDTGTWSCTGATNYPRDNGGSWNGTTIIIDNGDKVDIPNNLTIDLDNAAAINIIIRDGATLYFSSNPELFLPTGSTITIEDGGTLDAQSSSSKTLITIGGTGIWGRGAPSNCPSNETITVAGTIDGTSTCPTNAILPVNFLDFTASQQGNNIELAWSTTKEINNSHFILQESVDGTHFYDQDIIEGSKNSTIIKNYSSTLALKNQTTYYRIKQVDFNGEFDYSKTIIHTNNSTDFSIYPNPSTNKTISLKFDELGIQKLIQITDELGQIVHSTTLTTSTDYTFSLEKNGFYFVKVIQGDNVITKKLVLR